MQKKYKKILKRLKEFAKEFEIHPLLDTVEHCDPNDGVTYSDLIDYLHVDVLGFCGCGRPYDNAKYVADSLRLLATYKGFGSTFGKTNEEIHKMFEEFQEAEKEFFGNDIQAKFMYYYLDDKEFTEHGGSIPGWVDEKGHQFLEIFDMIDELNKDK